MRKFIVGFIAILFISLPFNGAFADKANAATTRVAVIKELNGTVKVKKAGGSKEFTAFAKMSLNEGDVLSVGSGGSAVLQFANGTSEDDKMTVGANTKLSFSKLSNKKGTTTKVSMWSGSAWVDVKSITSTTDEFTLETPTAVMGVRGTHLLVAVDSVSGATHLTVAAGVVATRTAGSENKETKDVYPTENALVTKDGEDNGKITIAPVDLSLLMKQSDKSIVEAIVKASGEVVKENKEKLEQYLEQSGSQNADDQARQKSNIESLLGAIVDNAVKAGLITQDRVSKLVAEAASQTGVDIDLTKKEIKLSDEEKLKQEEQKKKDEAAKKAAEEKKSKEQEERQKNAELLKQLEEQRKQQEEAKVKALEEKQKKALEEYEKQLSDNEKKRFEDDKKGLGQGQPSSASPSPEVGGGGSPSSSPKSSDANLSNLVLLRNPDASPAPLELSPAFASATTNYSVSVNYHTSLVAVKPTVSESHATVKVNGVTVASGTSSGSISLSAGENTITIVVTAEDGSSKTYSIKVIRQSAIPAELTGWRTSLPLPDSREVYWMRSPLDDLGLTYAAFIAAEVPTINMQLAFDTSTIGKITMMVYRSNSETLIDSKTWDQSGSQDITLTAGLNIINLKFYDPNNGLIKTYYLYAWNHPTEPNWSTKPFSLHSQTNGEEISLTDTPTDSVAVVNANVDSITLGRNNPDFVVYDVMVNGVHASQDGYFYLRDLSFGINNVQVYVYDSTGFFQHTYNLRIIRSDYPEGVSGMAVTKSDSTTAVLWNLMRDVAVDFGKYRYYVNVPTGNTKLDFTIAPGYTATLTPYGSETELSLDHTITIPFSTAGEYSYTLNVTKNNVTKSYEFVIVVGTPVPKELSVNHLDIDFQYTAFSTVDDANHPGFSVLLPESYLNGTAKLDFDYWDDADIEVYEANGSKIPFNKYTGTHTLSGLTGATDFQIKVFDPTHQASKVYKLTVYIGGSIPSNLQIASISVTDVSEPQPSVTKTDELHYSVDGIDASAISVSMAVYLNSPDAVITRVRLGNGDPIAPSGGGYPIPFNTSPIFIEIVVHSNSTNREICYVVALNRASS